jgi:hypothetical protein
MAADLASRPEDTLAALAAARTAIFNARNARVWIVGSSANQAAVAGALEQTLGALPSVSVGPGARRPRRAIDERVARRMPGPPRPVFVALVNPSAQAAVMINRAPSTSFADTTDEAILDYLASNLYTGLGEHSVGLKLWTTGICGGGGIGASLVSGQVAFSIEGAPDLGQVLRLVIDLLRAARPDPSLVEYALAGAFRSNGADAFEKRAQAIADDLADGLSPDVVRAFRARVLALRGRPGLAANLTARLERVYGRVLPGWGPPKSSIRDGLYFAIGPDAVLDPYARYLTDKEHAELVKLYPRDFWVD